LRGCAPTRGTKVTRTALMESLFILVPLSLVLAVLIGLAFWWSVNSGQFDDLDHEGTRVIDDDDR
jgi:cbb3-type cytochrome oxidase maturation protein